MISKTYLRYIWLLDTIKHSKYPLTFEDIVKIWEGSPYAYMGGLPIRTFHEHRKGIEEMLAQGGLSVAGRCRCLTKDSNTSIEKEGYIPYSLQA